MGTAPLRDLGKIGVVTDVDPFDLPPTAFSMATNCRFVDGRISAAPVWRAATSTLTTSTSPRFLLSYSEGYGTTTLYYAGKNGKIAKVTETAISTATETDVSEATWVAADLFQAYTGTFLNNVVYINRPDRVPWYIVKGSGGTFQKLTNWDANWRCESIRAVGGVLVAINMTLSGANYPQMVKWSDYSVTGAVPGTWTPGTTNSAGSNVLAEVPDRLVDGWPMRDRLILYSESECWTMDPSGDSNVFNFRRAFKDGGVINPNCVADVGGVHYVFGPNDIYRHDGIQKSPLATGVVNNFIYNNLNRANVSDCFVVHNPKLSEIMFCYPSVDGYCGFPLSTYRGANRAAVYNYRANTWTFYDLPYLGGMCFASLNVTSTYTSITDTYSSIGGTYLSFSDTAQLALFGAGNTGALGDGTAVPAKIRSFELINSTAFNGTLDTLCTSTAYFERLDFDLDELGVELRGNKVIRSIYPEGRFDAGSSPATFVIGIKMYPNNSTEWYSGQTFDGDTSYKLDFNRAGRYLSMKATYDATKGWSLNGLDFDIVVTSRR